MGDMSRINRDPTVMAGKPCIRNMRVTVAMIVGQIAEGATIDDLLQEFPYLEREDITQALRYAAYMASGQEIDLSPAA
jgi:uncharacterized protein (DUF433 family)